MKIKVVLLIRLPLQYNFRLLGKVREVTIVLQIKNELCPFLQREREREVNKVQIDLINAMCQLISWMT